MIRSVTWTHLLPEAGAEPTGFEAPPAGPFMRKSWTGQPLADPTAVGLQDAVDYAGTVIFSRQPGAERAVRAWPAELRRLAALRVHIGAVNRWIDNRSPDDGPARTMPVLMDDRMQWSRSDLAWALRTADGYGLFDGAAYLLPGYMAASLSSAELAGFDGALRAVFDDFIDERDTPRQVRKLLGALYGTAIGRAVDQLPIDLLPRHDPFGEYVRERCGRRLDEPAVTDLLRHAVSLGKPSPPKTWLRTAATFPVQWPVRTVLDCFVDHADHVSFGNDELLRGLAWMLSLDPSTEATALLGRVAVAAGSAGAQWPGYPYAPQTAAAVVGIMTSRSGAVPTHTLHQLAGTVANKALLTRVRTALDRLSTGPASPAV